MAAIEAEQAMDLMNINNQPQPKEKKRNA